VNAPNSGESRELRRQPKLPSDPDAWQELARISHIKHQAHSSLITAQPRARFRPRWLLRLGLILLIFTLVGALEGGQNLMNQYLANQPLSIWRALLLGLSDWYIWAALTPFVLLVAQYFPIGQRSWPLSLILHLVLSVVCATIVIQLTTNVLIRLQLGFDSAYIPKPTDRSQTGPSPIATANEQTSRISRPLDSSELGVRLLGARFAVYLVVYWTIVGVGHALGYYRKFRERELLAIQLESRLVQTQLQMLKMQLQPHFLFNTLNAISALMHQDVELADQMLARLAQLLRATLESAGIQEVPLKQELEFVELYLEIEQARIGPRLVVKIHAEAETMDAAVPNLILQPLVENAVRHGIAPRPKTGRIEINARRENSELCVEIMDDGPGLESDPSTPKREGVGLTNTRARLRQLYGHDHQFTFTKRAGGGLVITICVPFREIPIESVPADSDISLPRLPASSPAIPAPKSL